MAGTCPSIGTVYSFCLVLPYRPQLNTWEIRPSDHSRPYSSIVFRQCATASVWIKSIRDTTLLKHYGAISNSIVPFRQCLRRGIIIIIVIITFGLYVLTSIFGIGHHNRKPIQQSIRHCGLRGWGTVRVARWRLGTEDGLQGRWILLDLVAHQVLVFVLVEAARIGLKFNEIVVKWDGW